MTMAIDGFSFNVWGTMDLMAVNEGTGRLLINENPAATGSGNNGLQGRFSEIDYTFAYDHSFDDVSVGGGVIFYTFPDRFDTTTELYGTVGFDSVPLDPSVTLYVDVDETSAGNGGTGVYVNIAAGHSFGFNHDVFTGLDVGGSIAFANGGFGNFYYGIDDGGSHDASFTFSLPIAINDNWSAAGFVTYSSLLSGFRAGQFLDLRDVYRGNRRDPRFLLRHGVGWVQSELVLLTGSTRIAGIPAGGFGLGLRPEGDESWPVSRGLDRHCQR